MICGDKETKMQVILKAKLKLLFMNVIFLKCYWLATNCLDNLLAHPDLPIKIMQVLMEVVANHPDLCSRLSHWFPHLLAAYNSKLSPSPGTALGWRELLTQGLPHSQGHPLSSDSLHGEWVCKAQPPHLQVGWMEGPSQLQSCPWNQLIPLLWLSFQLGSCLSFTSQQ